MFIGNLAWDMTQDMAEEMLNDVLGPQSYSRVRLATDRCSIYLLCIYVCLHAIVQDSADVFLYVLHVCIYVYNLCIRCTTQRDG